MEFRTGSRPSQKELESFADSTLYQSAEWINFVSESQSARPVAAELWDGSSRVGWFTGLIIKKYSLKILGAPFPGWTTSYMGFNLVEGASRLEALKALIRFSKKELRCAHFELMDRHLIVEEVSAVGARHRLLESYEVDLSGDEEAVLKRFASSTRRNIKKGQREGVEVSIATDDAFADDYYEQMKEVFARQKLIPGYGVERVQMLLKHLLPTERLLCLRACTPDGTCIATGIFPADHHTMYFWGGASREQYRILRPNEAIQWYAMRYWQNKGVARYDMGGSGEYKRKYGGTPIAVPWLRYSHLPGLELGRRLAERIAGLRLRAR